MIGIDEVGRGAWAGPLLVVAARANTQLPAGLTDSKALTRQRREALIAEIEASCDLGCGWVSNSEVDSLGLTAAMRLAVMRALAEIDTQPDEMIIMDGHVNYCDPAYVNVITKIKADLTEPVVSAASVYAKVMRDTQMALEAEKFPNYGFESHVGYGTAKHIEALKTYGVTTLHRLSYKPVKAFV
jgi:ribonuclease HII